jgi:hypothetical protein
MAKTAAVVNVGRDVVLYDSSANRVRSVEVLDRNGSLVYVEDRDTLERQWVGREQLETEREP